MGESNRPAIRGALARAYCNDEHSHKILDPDLLESMVDEIEPQFIAIEWLRGYANGLFEAAKGMEQGSMIYAATMLRAEHVIDLIAIYEESK